MIKQSQDVLSWFDNMQNPVPTWYHKDFYLQYSDGIPFRLKKPFDLEFIHSYGKVFKVFDTQDSGNLCFGVQSIEGSKYFIKFAGAPTIYHKGEPQDAIDRLKETVPIYRDLAHPNLIRFIKSEEIGGGFVMVFEWVDAVCAHRMYPANNKVENYISYLESANLIYQSWPIDMAGKKVLKASPKIYIADAALRNELLMDDSILTDPVEMGKVVETAVYYKHVAEFYYQLPQLDIIVVGA